MAGTDMALPIWNVAGISPPTPAGYAENFGGTILVFCIAGAVAGFLGMLMFAAFKKLVTLMKSCQS